MGPAMVRVETPPKAGWGVDVTRCLITVLLGLVLGSPFALISTWAQSSDAPLSQDWSNVRKALEKYQDVVVAIRDGDFSAVLCVQDETAAGMGIHFLNRALLGPAADPCVPRSSFTSRSETSSNSLGQSGSSPWQRA
jgi:hypothetical protein